MFFCFLDYSSIIFVFKNTIFIAIMSQIYQPQTKEYQLPCILDGAPGNGDTTTFNALSTGSYK